MELKIWTPSFVCVLLSLLSAHFAHFTTVAVHNLSLSKLELLWLEPKDDAGSYKECGGREGEREIECEFLLINNMEGLD